MTTPQIPDEAVSKAGDVYYDWIDSTGSVDAAMRAALVAAEPYLRTTIAEEIAQAIEAKASDTSYTEAEEVTVHLLQAAQLAREVGAKANGDPT